MRHNKILWSSIYVFVIALLIGVVLSPRELLFSSMLVGKSLNCGNNNVVKISVAHRRTVALKSNGVVVEWGEGDGLRDKLCNEVSQYGTIVDMAAGASHTVALKNDGTVVVWGSNSDGQANVPPDLTRVVNIAAGASHTVALKNDGTVVVWGYNNDDQVNVPAGLQDVVDVAVGYYHIVALTEDGEVVAWGGNRYGQTNVPADLRDVVDVSASGDVSFALKKDGTVVGWGCVVGCTYDLRPPTGLSDVIKIESGPQSAVAIRRNGTVVDWGRTTSFPDLSGMVQIGVGLWFNAALMSDGTVKWMGYIPPTRTSSPTSTNTRTPSPTPSTTPIPSPTPSTTPIPSPSNFSKTSPKNNTTNLPVNIRLSWVHSRGATDYEYCLSQSAKTCNNWRSTRGTGRIDIQNLQRNKVYYWQIRAKNRFGITVARDGIWQFRTAR